MSKLCSTISITLIVIGLPAFAQVGIGTTSPNSMLDVRGSMSSNYRAFTSATTIAATDNTVVFTGTSATTVTLPTAVGIDGREYWIKNASTTVPTPVLTVATTSSQTIDGNASWTLTVANEVIRVISNGANWYVMNQDVASPNAGNAWVLGGNSVNAVKSLGTLNAFDLPFKTNNIERMRLNQSGYFGLNTTNPLGRLHIVNETDEFGDDYIFDDYGAGTTQGLYMTRARGTLASPANLQNGDYIGWIRFIPRANGALGYSGGTALEAFYKGDGTTNLTDLRFTTSSAEKMRISETGNVAIGATSWNATNPEKLLVDAGTTSSFNVISGRGSIDNYLQLNIQNRSDGDNASSDVVASANNATESANFIDMGINSSGYASTALPILAGINTAYLYSTGRDLVIGNGSNNRHLIFFTDGFDVADEKMRITNAGNVGIGITNPADKLSVAGVVAPSADNTYTCGKNSLRWSAVYAANGTIQTSDARMKTAIQPLQYGLKEVLQLQPVRFTWKDDAGSEQKIGLIAQQVQGIVPEVVSGDAQKEILGMNYAALIPVLINAVKEQQQQIDDIQKRVDTLKKKTQAGNSSPSSF
jgi:hypothetical protein